MMPCELVAFSPGLSGTLHHVDVWSVMAKHVKFGSGKSVGVVAQISRDGGNIQNHLQSWINLLTS